MTDIPCWAKLTLSYLYGMVGGQIEYPGQIEKQGDCKPLMPRLASGFFLSRGYGSLSSRVFMFMEIGFLVIAPLLVIFVVTVLFWADRRLRRSRTSEPAIAEDIGETAESLRSSTIPDETYSKPFASVDDPTVEGDLVVLSDSGDVILTCCEIDDLPECHELDINDNCPALNQAKQFATEFITRSMTLPGKTVQIAFDPVIQKGLNEGAYEVIKVASGQGNRLIARAVDTKKFVGQGRYMAPGKLKQLGVGAFHLVSIAVAQAHLAEINKNLEELKEGVKDLRDFLEDKDVAHLKGTVEYLEYLVDFIRRMDSPDLVPTEKRTELESIRREMMVWVAQIELEAGRLRDKIEGQGDEDGLSGGTGKTFGKLKEHSRASARLVRKYRLLLRMASLFYMTSAYLEPLALRDKDFTRVLKADDTTKTLMAVLQKLEDKSKTLLEDAMWNKKKTLLIRQETIKNEIQKLGNETIKEESLFTNGMCRLEVQLRKVSDPHGNVRMAITFDSSGAPSQVNLLTGS